MENTGKIINALLFGVLLFLFTFASIRLALAQQSWEKEWKETLAAANPNPTKKPRDAQP